MTAKKKHILNLKLEFLLLATETSAMFQDLRLLTSHKILKQSRLLLVRFLHLEVVISQKMCKEDFIMLLDKAGLKSLLKLLS